MIAFLDIDEVLVQNETTVGDALAHEENGRRRRGAATKIYGRVPSTNQRTRAESRAVAEQARG